jgi:hypothetical protein
MKTQRYLGGCQCGQLRFAAEGRPENVRICHCRQCQKATGSAFFARALYPTDKVAIDGRMTRFSSSDRLERASCPECGGFVLSLRKNGSMIAIALSAFDQDPGFKPTDHMWLDEKAAWLVLPDDGLARHERLAP